MVAIPESQTAWEQAETLLSVLVHWACCVIEERVAWEPHKPPHHLQRDAKVHDLSWSTNMLEKRRGG